MTTLPHYVLANPTGNITALVTEPVRIEEQAAVASLIFSQEPSCEQVGFISLHPEEQAVSIRMSGGEFCGNATLSAAAYACRSFGMSSGEISVRFDGIPGPLPVRVVQSGSLSFSGTVGMPLPTGYSQERFTFGADSYSLPVVRFPGISHILTDQVFARDVAEKAVRQWCSFLDVPALGLIQLQGDWLTPLVYVRDVESLYWERSCASGTCAAVYHLFRKGGIGVARSFREPGGVLSGEAGEGYLRLSGSVSFSA